MKEMKYIILSSSGSRTVINYGFGSGSDFLPSYGSGSGSTSQKVFHNTGRMGDEIKPRRGWDLSEWLERLAVNAKVATVLGSIPSSSDTVESEGRQMKQCVH